MSGESSASCAAVCASARAPPLPWASSTSPESFLVIAVSSATRRDKMSMSLRLGTFKAVERARHAILEHLLELVPGPGRPGAHVGEPLVGGGLRPLLKFLAFGDESLEHLDAFLLRLGESAETREPDLVGRIP